MIGLKNYKYEKVIEVNEYEEDKFGFRRCNCCLSSTKEEREKMGIGHTNKLFRLVVGGGNGGFEIYLCEECIKELKQKIEEKLGC